MTYPNNFIRLSFGGTIYQTRDIWSNTINFGAGSTNIPADLFNQVGTKIDTMAGKIQTWFKTTGMISVGCQLTWVKLALIGADGKYQQEPVVYDFPAPVNGSVTTFVEPQRALAITFESSRLRAPGRYGRIFIPMFAGEVTSEGLIKSDLASTVNSATKVLLDALNDYFSDPDNYLDQDVDAIVLSEKTTSHNTILKVKTGRVVDTIRSRRNKMKEQYSSTLPIDNE